MARTITGIHQTDSLTYMGYPTEYLDKVVRKMNKKLAAKDHEFNLKANGLQILIFRDATHTLITDSKLNDIINVYKEDTGANYDYETAIAILTLSRCASNEEMLKRGFAIMADIEFHRRLSALR